MKPLERAMSVHTFDWVLPVLRDMSEFLTTNGDAIGAAIVIDAATIIGAHLECTRQYDDNEDGVKALIAELATRSG